MKNNQTLATPRPQSSKRILAIDRFRGIAVLCMILFQFMNNFEAFGILARFSNHNISTGILIFANTTIADLIAPMFMFALALTYKMSYDRRTKTEGKRSANLHFLVRNLGLIGIGAVLQSISYALKTFDGGTTKPIYYLFWAFTIAIALSAFLVLVFNIKPIKKHKPLMKKILIVLVSIMGIATIVVGAIDFVGITAQIAGYEKTNFWMVLQSLGFAGLVALPVMNLNHKWRGGIGLVLLAIYTLYYNFLGGQVVINQFTQGGFIGGFGWGIIVILSTVFAETFASNKERAYLYTLLATIVSLAAYFVFPVLKSGVRPDPTYLMVAITFSAYIFIIVDLFNFYKLKFDPLAWWGRYPILLYLLEFFVIGAFINFSPNSIIKDAPLWLAITTTTVMLVGLTVLVWWLNKRNKKISL